MARNNKEDLRPVGTEFDYLFPPATTSTDPRGHKVRYKVKAHELAGRFPHDPEPEWVEVLDTLSVEPIDEH